MLAGRSAEGWTSTAKLTGC